MGIIVEKLTENTHVVASGRDHATEAIYTKVGIKREKLPKKLRDLWMKGTNKHKEALY